MNTELHKNVLSATRYFMIPIARFLLRTGIGYREFSEIAKLAFVDVASTDYGIRGRPTNISRIAVMTGLTRKEVKRLRDKIVSNETMSHIRQSPGSEILHSWFQDPDFVGSNGQPVPIPYEGEGISFVTLARRYGGDIPPGALRKELERVGAISETEDGLISVTKRQFIPVEVDDQFVQSAARSLRYLASTIAYNTMNPGESGRIERYAFSERLKKQSLPRFRRFAREHVSSFTEFVEDWIAGHEIEFDESKSGQGSHAGIGFYYFEEN